MSQELHIFNQDQVGSLVAGAKAQAERIKALEERLALAMGVVEAAKKHRGGNMTEFTEWLIDLDSSLAAFDEARKEKSIE